MSIVLSPDQILGLVRSGFGLLKNACGLLSHREHTLKWASRRRLVFVEKHPSCWDTGLSGADTVVILETSFTITNPNPDGGNLVITRAQVRRVGLLIDGPKDEAQYVVVGGEVLFLGRVGIPIDGRTSTVLYLRHGFTIERVPSDTTRLRFKIILMDQFNRRHTTSIKVAKFRRKPVVSPPRPGGQPTAV